MSNAPCNECRPEWLAWLDYKLPPVPIKLITIGSDSPREMRERQEARFRLWRDTIRSQQQIIADNCTRLHGAPKPAVAVDEPPRIATPTAPTWQQGDLLAELTGAAA